MRKFFERFLYNPIVFRWSIVLELAFLIILLVILSVSWVGFSDEITRVNTSYLREACVQFTMNLDDTIHELFRSEVETINQIPSDWISQAKCQQVAQMFRKDTLVSEVYIMKNTTFTSSSGEMVDSGKSNRFLQFRRQAKNSLSTNFPNWLMNQAQSIQYLPSDNHFYIVKAYDKTGHPLGKPKSRSELSQVVTNMVIVELDRSKVNQYLKIRLETELYNHSRYGIWLIDSLRSFGVISGTDTVYWHENKSFSKATIGENWEWKSNPWFTLQSNYRKSLNPNEVLDGQNHKEKEDQVSTILKYFGLILFSLVFIAILLQTLRMIFIWRFWRRRQSALEQFAHSVKTPVTRLRLSVDTIREHRTVSPEEEKSLIDTLHIECQRLERAVDNAALQMSSNSRKITKSELSSNQISAEITENWSSQFAMAGLTLQCQTPDHFPFYADHDQLIIVLDNLLDNALRHSRLNPEKSTTTVTLAITRTNKNVLFTIDDVGRGVPKRDRKRIFQRFERGSNTAVTGASGLGIGLSLVKEIVAAHHGTVSVDDAPHHGARFTVTLPLR